MKDKGAVAKLYRLERWLYCHKFKIMANIIYIGIQVLFSCVIPPTCKIGDDFFIGANAVIVGKVNIGNNVKIGALTFVNFDIEYNCTVVGYKGKKWGN